MNLYNSAIENRGHAVAGEEVLTREQMRDEYLMLALRSRGLDLAEYQNLFGRGWFNSNKVYLNQLEKDGFIILEKNLIRFTGRGYAVCDEVLSNFK